MQITVYITLLWHVQLSKPVFLCLRPEHLLFVLSYPLNNICSKLIKIILARFGCKVAAVHIAREATARRTPAQRATERLKKASRVNEMPFRVDLLLIRALPYQLL